MDEQARQLKKEYEIKLKKSFDKTRDLIVNEIDDENYSANVGKYFSNDFDGFYEDKVIIKAIKDEKILETVDKRFKERMKNELEDFKKKPFDYSLKVILLPNKFL